MRDLKATDWTPEIAYIIGLLVTDGNLSKNGRHIIMRSSDIDLLHTFIQLLSLTNKIGISVNDGYAIKPSYRVQFSNVSFYKFLVDIGLFPNKTYTISAIKIPNMYFRDFLRGHLDGDGSIITYQDLSNKYKGVQYTHLRIYIKFISASKEHIVWLSQKITELAFIKGTITHDTRSRNNEKKVTIWGIKFSKKESISLLKWIYYQPDLPCLQRKFEIAKLVLEKSSKEQRKIYTKIESQKLLVARP